MEGSGGREGGRRWRGAEVEGGGGGRVLKVGITCSPVTELLPYN